MHSKFGVFVCKFRCHLSHICIFHLTVLNCCRRFICFGLKFALINELPFGVFNDRFFRIFELIADVNIPQCNYDGCNSHKSIYNFIRTNASTAHFINIAMVVFIAVIHNSLVIIEQHTHTLRFASAIAQ